MSGINAWWELLPGERFWLGITGSDGRGQVLAAPCLQSRHGPTRGHPLITHVKDGDVVFHYDEARRAIVAWSTSRGRVERRQIGWGGRGDHPDAGNDARRVLPSWAIRLESPTALESAVPLDLIARTQWELFPELRAFEERAGDPLYFPFELGSPSETHLLDGYVFKLPALFVERVPAMELVAQQLRWSEGARSRANGSRGTQRQPAARPSRAPITGAPTRTGALQAR